MDKNKGRKKIAWILIFCILTATVPMDGIFSYASEKTEPAEEVTEVPETEIESEDEEPAEIVVTKNAAEVIEVVEQEEESEHRTGADPNEREVLQYLGEAQPGTPIGSCTLNESSKTACMTACYDNSKMEAETATVPRILVVTDYNGSEIVMDYTDGPTVSANGYSAEDAETYIGKAYTVTALGEDCFVDDTTTQIINLPNTIVSDITVDFFRNCRALKAINIDVRQGDNGEYGRYYDGADSHNTNTGKYTAGVLIDLKNTEHTVTDKKLICCPPRYAYDTYTITAEKYLGTLAIGDCAFQNCTNLRSVRNITSARNYISSVGDRAFYNCPQLATVEVLDTMCTRVGDEAFRGCSALQSIKINKLNGSLTQTYGDFVFQDTQIAALELPKSVVDVRGATFYGMDALAEITVDVDNVYYAAWEGVLYSYSEDADHHIGSRMIVLPSVNNRAIVENSFTIPFGVMEFDDYAMYNCQNLKTLIFPSGVFGVGTRTMSDNRALRNVYIYSGFPDLEPDVVDDPDSRGQFENIFGLDITQAEKNNFRIYCGKNTRAWQFAVDCGYSPISLYDEANYTSMSDGNGGRILTGYTYDAEYKDVIIPNFVVTDATTRPTTKEYYTAVAANVLANPNITSVRFSVSMSEIDPNAFRIVPDEDDYTKDTNAESLQNIYIEEGNKKLASVEGVLYKMAYNSRTESYYIEELLYYPVGRTDTTYRTVSSLSYLPQNAFRGAYNLKIVEVYDTIQSIGRISELESNETAAFSGCKNLVAIDVISNGTTEDDEFIRYGSDKGVLYGVDEGIMRTLLYYPKGERIPGDTGHSGGAYEVVDGCTTIHDVKNCIYLKSITMPKSVTTIDADAFSGSTELKELIIRESSNHSTDAGLQTVGDRAFRNTKLENVTLPNTIRSIGEEAFYGCSRLASVVIKADDVLSIGENAFYGDRALRTVKIYGTQTDARGGEVTVGEDAFARCTALTSLDATNLTSIAFLNGSFSYNTSLSTIDFTQTNVNTIEENAFRGCSALKNIDLYDSDGLSVIGDSAFKECTSLERVTLPIHLTQIATSAFENCKNLLDVNFADLSYLTAIDSKAFRGCGFTVVSLKRGLVHLGDCAFQSCAMLTSMYVPETVTDIEGNPFYGFGRNLLIYGRSGSTIETFIQSLSGTKPTFIAGDIPLTTVNVDRTYASIYDVGVTDVQLSAITQNPEDAPVIWKSMDTEIATVDSTTGLVHAGTRTGTTTIRAICTTNGAYDTCTIEVVETKIIVPEDNIVLNRNGSNRSVNLNASSIPLRAISYRSADSRIASVNRKGVITGKRVGTTTITARAGSKEDGTYRETTVNVTVLKASTKLDKKKITLNNAGDEENLYAELTATHTGSDETVVWKTSNPRVVAIPAPDTDTNQTTGDTITVTALRAGTATITATCNGVKSTCKVTVKPVTTRLNYTTLTMYVGGSNLETKRLKAKTTGISKSVEWSSDHDEYATVDERGYVTAVGRGTATITATCNGVAATCLVRVLDSTVTIRSGEASDYDISKGIVLNSKGDNKYQLNATVVGRKPKVKWSSTAKDVVTVNSKGMLTGKSYGDAEIIATANGVDTSCSITVLDTQTELDVSKLMIHLKSDALTSQTLTVNIEGADYTRRLEWWSSDSDIVEITRADSNANGNATTYTGTGTAYITARKAGKATIYVRANGVTSKCVVTVSND